MQSSYAGLPDKVHVDTFTRLLGFTGLYLIDIQLGENESRITTLLKMVIISCRNLKVLRLDMSLWISHGWMEGPLSVWYFTAEQGNKFPPLQELVLSHYNDDLPNGQSNYDFSNVTELRILKLQNPDAYSVLVNQR